MKKFRSKKGTLLNKGYCFVSFHDALQVKRVLEWREHFILEKKVFCEHAFMTQRHLCSLESKDLAVSKTLTRLSTDEIAKIADPFTNCSRKVKSVVGPTLITITCLPVYRPFYFTLAAFLEGILLVYSFS